MASKDRMSIPAMALQSAARFGNALALDDGNRALSFDDVREEMLMIARALMTSGVEPGDRVALWSPNSVTWVIAALGVLASGAWLVPVNSRFKAAEAGYLLDRTDARYLMVADGFLGGHQLDSLRVENPQLRALADPVLLPAPGRVSRPEWDAFVERAQATSENLVLERIGKISSDDVSDVIFTSGTTGSPKGVMLRHGTSLRCFEAFNRSFQVHEADRVLITVPFFHCFGYKAGWMLDLMQGATTFAVAAFEPLHAMEAIQQHRITHLPGPPTIFQAILDHPRRREFDLTSLRSVVVSATTVPVELLERLKRELGTEFVMTGYGLTENHALATVTLPSDPPETIAGTVGHPIPGVELRVVDEADHDLPAGFEGEILIRGYTLMSGYYGDDDATSAAIVDGWLHTGDVGALDAEGYLRITDRKKDIYIVGGFNVAPAEVEKTLSAMEQIAQIAVVGVPNEYLGEVGVAFVVLKPGHQITPDDVLAYARGRLANYKVPRTVRIVESLPMNATGKVVKEQLRAWVASSGSG